MSDINPPPGVPKTVKGPNGETMFYAATRTLTPTTDKTVKEVIVRACENRWAEVQKEAEAIVAPRGDLIADPRARNARINAAYAKLWLEDNRFQWAGLAAFASKQVGCGLLHAATLTREAEQLGRMAIGDPSLNDAYALPVRSSSQMLSLLALGNTALFLDIYPLHLFYMRYGIERFEACVKARQNIDNEVLWPVDRRTLRFGYPFSEILQGFPQIDQGQVAQGVVSLAQHEQVNILQKVIYDRPDMQLLLRSNQAAWVTSIPSGVAAEIQLTLAAQCGPVAGRTETFPRTLSADLADKDQRMLFVTHAAQRFDVLLHGPARADIERSIRAIAAGGGVQ
jgi:hypothetical protein